MDGGFSRGVKKVVYSSEVEQSLKRWKKRDNNYFRQIEQQIFKVIRAPELGKPLRHSLKNRRRVHVGSFVLVYEFYNEELRFLDFDHHDRIYKKHP